MTTRKSVRKTPAPPLVVTLVSSEPVLEVFFNGKSDPNASGTVEQLARSDGARTERCVLHFTLIDDNLSNLLPISVKLAEGTTRSVSVVETQKGLGFTVTVIGRLIK